MEIPEIIGNLTRLTTLQLYTNRLSGPIPPSLGNLVNLLDLELAENHLSGGIPTSLGNLTNLDLLILSKGVFSSRKVREKVAVAHFGFIWQLLSNHGVISLKRFVSSFTTKLYN